MKRVFIAVNLSEEIKEKLVEWQEKHKNFGVRWTKKGSLHITLCFLGWIDEKRIEDIKLILMGITKNYKPFDIYLTDISVGPDEKNPRMIWVNGPVADELKNLQKEIAESLKEFCRKQETRDFRIHITLARAKTRIRLIREELDLKFSVNSFELMESKLLRDGAEYSVIESFKLGV